MEATLKFIEVTPEKVTIKYPNPMIIDIIEALQYSNKTTSIIHITGIGNDICYQDNKENPCKRIVEAFKNCKDSNTENEYIICIDAFIDYTEKTGKKLILFDKIIESEYLEEIGFIKTKVYDSTVGFVYGNDLGKEINKLIK